MYQTRPLNEKTQIHTDSSKELWRDIPGLQGHYRISDRGRVKSVIRQVRADQGFRTIPARILKPCKNGNGYFHVTIREKTRKIHHLVLLAFVGPCPDGMECRHFPDPCITNNNLKNLSWGTRQENIDDKDTLGRTTRGSQQGSAKLTEDRVLLLRKLHASKSYTLEQLAEMFKVAECTIFRIVHRESWTHI